jgi:hypothetical protein
MDVDVLRYASDWVGSGYFGSEQKLSSGVAFSPKTKLFYPLEGIGIVAPLTVFVHASNLLSSDTGFIIYTFNQVFSALSVMFIFLILSMFLRPNKALIYTAVFGLGTPLFVHSKYLLPEPVTLLAITMSLYFLLRFRREKRTLFIFLSGLSSGYSLLARPDAPIFAGIFFVLAAYTVFRAGKCLFVKNLFFLSLGLSVFALVFAVSNHQRYGSFLETGYTIDRKMVRSSLENELPLTYAKLEAISRLVEREDASDDNYMEAVKLYRQFQSMQKYLEETEKVLAEYGETNTAFYTNGFMNFLHGIYLILFSPNRSIFFLSPFMLFFLIPLYAYFRRFRIEFLLAGAVIAGYLVLYALRAPLSYAGSAAWGVRYLLPVYPLLFLGVIFYERSEFSKKKAVQMVFYTLFFISILFQIIGSGVNYQSVQMPLEYKSKQIYGTEDMTWAHESRKSMMTDFSSSLLLNNARIMLGSLTPEQEEYGVETGPNDWFFLQVIKGEGQLVRGKEHLAGNFKLIFFLLLACFGVSAYLIRDNFFKKDTGK